MIFEKTHFPFAMLSPSVHSMCGHNPELFTITKGAPIAIYSEQGSEAWNKHIRSYKSGPAARARQTSIQDNILDIYNRMMIQTHPQIASRKRQVHVLNRFPLFSMRKQLGFKVVMSRFFPVFLFDVPCILYPSFWFDQVRSCDKRS